MGPGAHHYPPATGAVGLANATHAIDDAGGGEVRPRHQFHQLIDTYLGALDHRQTGGDDLPQVMGRDVGRHAHGDTGGAVDQQVGEARRQDRRLLLGLVVVGDEIDRLLVQVVQQTVGDARHAHLGVTHGRGGVTVHGAEVALAVHQHVAHGKGLSHAHDGVVDGGIAMGVILTDDVADHARRLLVGLVPVVAQFVHGEQDPAMDRLEAVAHVRQRPAHDHAHGVIQVGLTHLVFQVDGDDFFGEIRHGDG